MEVELGEGRLLFHEHHGSLALLHHLELLLLLAHLLLVLELDLVVPLELFLGVASLQIQLELEVASMRLDDLLLVVAVSLGLGRLEIGQVLSALLGLQLLFFLLLGRLLRLSGLNDDGLGEGHLNGKFEIGRHEQLVHLNFARDVHVVESDGQVRGAQPVERLLRNHEVVQRQGREFKFILTDHRVIVQFDELVRNCALIDVWQGQRNSQAELATGQVLCLRMQLLEHLCVLHDQRLDFHPYKAHISQITAVPAKLQLASIHLQSIIVLSKLDPILGRGASMQTILLSVAASVQASLDLD